MEDGTMDFGEGQYPDNKYVNIIHPTAVIGPDVVLGINNFIGPYAVITGKTVMGDHNFIYSHAVIGSEPEHRGYMGMGGDLACKGVIIGDNCVIREFTTINAGTKEHTILESNVVMLRGSHVGHDSYIGYGVTLSCNVLVGGESYIFEGANMGLGSICHQYSVIGAYSMIGMGAVVTKKSVIRPGQIYVGNPAKFLAENLIGLKRAGISSSYLETLTRVFLCKLKEKHPV